jgi:hypothetical protein
LAVSAGGRPVAELDPAGKEGAVRLSGSVPPESAGLTHLAELSRGRDLLTSPERRNIFVEEVRMGFRADFERAPGSRPKRKFLSFNRNFRRSSEIGQWGEIRAFFYWVLLVSALLDRPEVPIFLLSLEAVIGVPGQIVAFVRLGRKRSGSRPPSP